MTVPGWPVAFRGSHAVAAGLVTPDGLRGPRFRRLLPDVYCRAVVGRPTCCCDRWPRTGSSRAGACSSGYSAAALLDAGCAPQRDTPAEVTLLGGNLRAHPGLVVRRDRLRDNEVTTVRGIAVHHPAAHRVRPRPRPDQDEAVVAVDRLANRHRFHPDRLLELCVRYRGRRGVARVPGVVALASPYAGSPMETRLRLLIVAGRAAPAEVQWVVQDSATRTAFWLDLAWPELKIGIEYEGEPHTEPGRVLRDIARTTRLVDLGWRVYRYTKQDMYGDRARIVAELVRARARWT